MKLIQCVFTSVLLVGSASALAEEMVITDAAILPVNAGPAVRFDGVARSDFIVKPMAPSQLSAGKVTFEPGARTAWHSHPLGQTLVVTAGSGWVQQEGGPKHQIGVGDVVWTPPGVRHWHGATPTSGMAHVAIQEMQGGKAADWYEKVSDNQYLK